MKTTARYIAAFMIAFVGAFQVMSQSTVFSMMQDREKQADKHFDDGDYEPAIETYEQILEDDAGSVPVWIKLAQANYYSKNYKEAVDAYEAALALNVKLEPKDLLLLAESYSAITKYNNAKTYYGLYTAKVPEDEIASKKLWRLGNLQFLYEDSAHISVRPLPRVNTTSAELCATTRGNQIIFMSNRKVRPVDHATEDESAPHFALYAASWKTDPVLNMLRIEGEPERYATSLKTRFNSGPVAFYNKGNKMVYVASSAKPAADGYRSLGLYFATQTAGEWKMSSAFPHNSDAYLITDVTINEEGTIMWFSSDMKGGLGGKDIYKSENVNGVWSKPVNAGEPINTNRDESYPYLYKSSTLYFSSNGHPGMGGLDIFKAAVLKDGFSEPENIGYPINSNGDDFAITFDAESSHGFFTSSREGGADDNLYEFNMDLQTYPLKITGTLKYKENSWSNAKEVTWPDVILTLVDTWRNANVLETRTTRDGSFSFSIPYYGRYHIMVTTKDGSSYMAGLELDKHKTSDHDYEIVVIKDLYVDQGKSNEK